MNKTMKILATVGLMVVASLAPLYYQNRQVPDLGVEDGKLKPLGSHPNGVSTQTVRGGKRVQPLPFKESLEATREALLETLNAHGGAELKRADDHYIYVVFVTPLMRWRDDAEFYLDEETESVHFRSQSRAGRSDLGLNKKRWERLSELYNQR